jgi:hypothetical protein
MDTRIALSADYRRVKIIVKGETASLRTWTTRRGSSPSGRTQRSCLSRGAVPTRRYPRILPGLWRLRERQRVPDRCEVCHHARRSVHRLSIELRQQRLQSLAARGSPSGLARCLVPQRRHARVEPGFPLLANHLFLNPLKLRRRLKGRPIVPLARSALARAFLNCL